jgi:cytochrome c-type biogenesis protein CcmH
MNDAADKSSDQLGQLDALLAAGVLDTKSHARARARLAGGPAASRRWAVDPLLVAALIAGLAVVGLGYVGMGRASGPAVASVNAHPAPMPTAAAGMAPHSMNDEQVRTMVTGLEQRLAATPDDAEGWGMLARSWTVLGDTPKAIAAYRRALPLSPSDAVLHADFADALAASQGHRIEGEAMKLVEQALAIDPDQPKALSLAGTAAFNRGDFAAAVRHWGHLQDVGPADHPLVRQMAAGLAEARQRAGLPGQQSRP